MLTENAIINELFQKIDIHNKGLEKVLGDVDSKSQLKMFYLIVVNIVVYILLGALSGGGNELVHGVNNAVFNLAITILLIFLPSPIGKNYIKNKAEASQLYTDISPKYDFYGNWGYKTTFTLGSFDDGSDEFKLVDENMNFTEVGESEWKKTPLGFHIVYGQTQFYNEKGEEIKGPHIKWLSSPVSFSEKMIEWHFEGKIEKWSQGEDIGNEFIGTESYVVDKRDNSERPIHLIGSLKGFIIMNKHCFYLTAKSEFNKIM